MPNQRRETIEEISARLAEAEAADKAQIQQIREQARKALAERKAAAEAERQRVQQQCAEERRAEAEARFEREHMEPAKRAWLAAGGTLEGFEQVKEQLRQELMLELARKPDPARAKYAQWARNHF